MQLTHCYVAILRNEILCLIKVSNWANHEKMKKLCGYVRLMTILMCVSIPLQTVKGQGSLDETSFFS